jgi:hypothetical protein
MTLIVSAFTGAYVHVRGGVKPRANFSVWGVGGGGSSWCSVVTEVVVAPYSTDAWRT